MATADLSGKAPRTATEIRSVLNAVQANVPHADEGPLIGGLRPDDPIVVAAFYSLVEIERLTRMLEAEGIGSQTRRFGPRVQVSVRMADLERAKQIVARHAAGAHDSPRRRRNTLERYRTWGMVIGLVLAVTVPMPLAALLAGHRDSLAVGLPFCTGVVLGPCGLLAGYLWGIVATHKLWRCSAGSVSRLRRVFNRCKVSP